MNKLSKYNDFTTEREFDKIVFGIYKLVESAYTQEWDFTGGDEGVKVGDTIEWDLTPKKPFEPIKDEPTKPIVWDFTKDVEKQSKGIKDYINYIKSVAKGVKSGATRLRDYMNEGDVDIEFDMNSEVFKQIVRFIKRLNKEQVKEYFFKLLEKFNGLSYGVKRDLFIKLSLLIIGSSNLQIGDLISDDDAESDRFLSEVKVNVIKEKEKEAIKVDIKSDTESTEVEKVVNTGSSFENANKLVSFVEGGYTDNPIDAGNWTNGPNSKSGHLIGTNHGIAAFTIINTKTMPTANDEIRTLRMCYSSSEYKRLAMKEFDKTSLSFGEQWRLDQKYIEDYKDKTSEERIFDKWKTIQKTLNKKTAKNIYESEYWNPYNFSNIKSQSIANILYDSGVNQGPGIAKRVYINSMGVLGYDVNDVNGWKSIHKKLTPIVNSMDKVELKKLHKEIKKQRLHEYSRNKSPEDIAEFGDGWENRLDMDINTFDKDLS